MLCLRARWVSVCVCVWEYTLHIAAIVPFEMTVGIFVLYISYYGRMNT